MHANTKPSVPALAFGRAWAWVGLLLAMLFVAVSQGHAQVVSKSYDGTYTLTLDDQIPVNTVTIVVTGGNIASVNGVPISSTSGDGGYVDTTGLLNLLDSGEIFPNDGDLSLQINLTLAANGTVSATQVNLEDSEYTYFDDDNFIFPVSGVVTNLTWAAPGSAPPPPPTLKSLAIIGPGSLASEGSGSYQAQATYSDGSTKIVAASWSSSSSSLTISGSGTAVTATAGLVTAATTATLTATYSTVSASLSVTIKPNTVGGGGGISGVPSAVIIYDQSKFTKWGEPVDPATGAENFYRTLISLSGLREIGFSVNYNSLQTASSADLGYGWSHTYLATAQTGTNTSGIATVAITWAQNQANTYTAASASSSTYKCADLSAEYDVVTKTSGGFVLTKPDGTAYTFTNSGTSGLAYLAQIANRFGQALNINRDSSGEMLSSITEPVSGASLSFTYTGSSITKISDSAGRSVSLSYDANDNLVGITDVNGHTAAYAYDANHRLTKVTAPDGSVILANTYDSAGRVASQTDGIAGNPAASFAYDETSQPGYVVTTITDHTRAKFVYIHDATYLLRSLTDPLGNVTTYSYDAYGNLTGVKDALGRTTSYTYDADGNRLTAVDATGNTTSFTYDANHNILSIINAAGKTSTVSYNGQNNPLQLVDFTGAKTLRVYGANSELTQETSPVGSVTSFGYTGGLLTSITDPYSNKTTFTYDAVGRVIGSTDPTGATSVIAYSPSGKVLSATDPLGDATTFAYDARDRPISETDPAKGVTLRSYDANNNLVTFTDALGGVNKYSYDGENRLTKATDPLGDSVIYAYDASGRMTSTTDPIGNVTKFDYDAVGNRTAIVDPLGNKFVQNSYDPRNLLNAVTDSLGRTTAGVYNALANLTQTTDPSGNSITYGYDAMNRPTQTVDPLGLKGTQSYDSDGNRTSLTDALGTAVSFTYDNADRLVTLTTAGGHATSCSYDPRGLFSKVVDPSGNVTALTFDAAGRLTKAADSMSEIDYAYDSKARLLTVTENTNVTSRVYDAKDRLTKSTDANGNVLQYAYDADDNLTGLTYPDGKKVTYSYDADRRMTQVADWEGRVTKYTYDQDSRLIKTIRPNNTIQTLAYDLAGQLISMADTASDGSTIVQYTYVYDSDGRLLTESRIPALPTYAPTGVVTTYDVDQRLTTYAGQTVSYSPNGDPMETPLGGTMASLTYDARDRLTSAGGIVYGYDAENRRLQSATTAGTTTYVVNSNSPLSQLLVSTAPSGSTTRNVYGLGLIYEDTDGTTVRYLHRDSRGSTLALTEAAGTVTGRLEYGPYGEVVSQTGDTVTPFCYVGAAGVETDANGLAYMRARYYNPQIRRFLQQDGYLGDLSMPGTLNRYAYTGGDPADRIDATGRGPTYIGSYYSASSPPTQSAATDETGICYDNGSGLSKTYGAGSSIFNYGSQAAGLLALWRLGNNLKLYSLAVNGNKSFKVIAGFAPASADLLGKGLLGLGLAVDLVGLLPGTGPDGKPANTASEVIRNQAVAGGTFLAVGAEWISGPAGWTIGAVYFVGSSAYKQYENAVGEPAQPGWGAYQLKTWSTSDPYSVVPSTNTQPGQVFMAPSR